MTSDELRKAGEEWVRWYRNSTAKLPRPDMTDPLFDGATAIVSAWLADHPADDAEPVTAVWLASVGITEDEGRPNGDIYVCAWVGRWNPGRVEILIGERGNQTYIPDGMTPQTRGPFRRLCAALGVPLVEPA